MTRSFSFAVVLSGVPTRLAGGVVLDGFEHDPPESPRHIMFATHPPHASGDSLQPTTYRC